MATLNDVLSEVYLKTKRPDLVEASISAVKAATLKAHTSDFFARDLREESIRFVSSATQQEFDYKVLFPRWRKIKYAYTFDSITSARGKAIVPITPEEMFDEFQRVRVNVLYEAGQSLEFLFDSPQQFVTLGFYEYPDVSATNYSSWIADEYIMAIVDEAVATVFRDIGFSEQAAAVRRDVREIHYPELKRLYLPVVGF